MPRTPYPLSNISDPHLLRVLQDMVDRQSFLEGEIERLGGSIPVGMAKRESPAEGIITIPYRDHGGRDGSVRVSRDGVIVSYTNPVESLFPYVDSRVVGNITTGIDPLHSYTLRAGTLSRDGDLLRISYSGLFATSANTKRIRILFDGQVIEDFGGFSFSTAAPWKVIEEYVRISPTSIRASSLGMYGEPLVMDEGVVAGTPDIIHLSRNAGLTATANLNTTDVVLLVQGEATATDEIQQTMSIIEYYRPSVVITI